MPGRKDFPQSGAEMLQSLADDRERMRHRGRQGGSLYAGDEKDAARAESLRCLVNLTAGQLAESLEREPVTLASTEAVKRQAMRYLSACSASGMLPTMGGLARALGYSRRMMDTWRAARPEHETSLFLEQYQDVCIDCLNAAALDGKVHPIVSIFIQKSMNGLRDSSEVVLTPGKSESIDQLSADEIARRYEFEEGESEVYDDL